MKPKIKRIKKKKNCLNQSLILTSFLIECYNNTQYILNSQSNHLSHYYFLKRGNKMKKTTWNLGQLQTNQFCIIDFEV